MTNTAAVKADQYLPRILRAGKAPAYLGMSRAAFAEMVRPYVREIRIGIQGVGFDRYELDQWADNYIKTKSVDKASPQDNNPPCSGRPGEKQWREKRSPVSTRGTVSGTSTRSSEVLDFKKALEQAKGKKPSST